MDIFEGVDWEGLGEFIEPVAGLLIALLFMGFVRLMKKSSRRRQQTPVAKTTRTAAQGATRPAPKTSLGAAPIEPGDDAAKLSRRFSQSSPK